MSQCVVMIPMEYDYGFLPYVFTFRTASPKAKVLDVIKATDAGPHYQPHLLVIVRDEYDGGMSTPSATGGLLVVPVVGPLTVIDPESGRYVATIQHGAYRYLFFETSVAAPQLTGNAISHPKPESASAGTVPPKASGLVAQGVRKPSEVKRAGT